MHVKLHQSFSLVIWNRSTKARSLPTVNSAFTHTFFSSLSCSNFSIIYERHKHKHHKTSQNHNRYHNLIYQTWLYRWHSFFQIPNGARCIIISKVPFETSLLRKNTIGDKGVSLLYLFPLPLHHWIVFKIRNPHLQTVS